MDNLPFLKFLGTYKYIAQTQKPTSPIQNTHVSADLFASHAGTFSTPKYMSQAAILELAYRGVTVEANMSKPSPKLGTDLITHFQ